MDELDRPSDNGDPQEESLSLSRDSWSLLVPPEPASGKNRRNFHTTVSMKMGAKRFEIVHTMFVKLYLSYPFFVCISLHVIRVPRSGEIDLT